MRFQSVCDLLEVAVFFIPGCLSRRNDSDHFISFRMHNDHYALIKQSKCDKAFFSIIETIIRNRDSVSFKHLFDSREINSMFEKVGSPLSFIPLKSHQLIVVTDYSYVKKGAVSTNEGLTNRVLSRGASLELPVFLRQTRRSSAIEL